MTSWPPQELDICLTEHDIAVTRAKAAVARIAAVLTAA